jgi:hypothetical protein
MKEFRCLAEPSADFAVETRWSLCKRTTNPMPIGRSSSNRGAKRINYIDPSNLGGIYKGLTSDMFNPENPELVTLQL